MAQPSWMGAAEARRKAAGSIKRTGRRQTATEAAEQWRVLRNRIAARFGMPNPSDR